MNKLKECKNTQSCYGILHCDNRCCNIERLIIQSCSGLNYDLVNFFLEDNSDNNIKELIYTKSRLENEIFNILEDVGL